MARPAKAQRQNIISITAAAEAPKGGDRSVVISPPKFEIATLKIVGNAPLVMHKFSAKAQATIVQTQEAGQVAKKGRKREAKDFSSVYREACHVSTEGWHGIPAAAFRNACISACRIVGFKMTVAKMSVFVVADGFEPDGTPLVRITEGTPVPFYAPARNSNGSTDIRVGRNGRRDGRRPSPSNGTANNFPPPTSSIFSRGLALRSGSAKGGPIAACRAAKGGEHLTSDRQRRVTQWHGRLGMAKLRGARPV